MRVSTSPSGCPGGASATYEPGEATLESLPGVFPSPSPSPASGEGASPTATLGTLAPGTSPGAGTGLTAGPGGWPGTCRATGAPLVASAATSGCSGAVVSTASVPAEVKPLGERPLGDPAAAEPVPPVAGVPPGVWPPSAALLVPVPVLSWSVMGFSSWSSRSDYPRRVGRTHPPDRRRTWHRGRVLDLGGALVLARSGLLAPARPDRLLAMGLALARWRLTPATGYAAGAARHPDRVAVVDDEGPLTYREVDALSSRIAGELLQRGLRDGDAAGLLARNGRGFVLAATALAKCGVDVLYLGTSTATAQLREVLDREGARLVVHDEELDPPLDHAVTTEELLRLAQEPGASAPSRVRRTSRQVIMTSGTTGTPRGAARSGGRAEDAVAMLSSIPMRARETTVIAAPVFHAWGLGQLTLAMVLGSTAVLSRRFDPEQVLQAVQEHRATALVVVPVLLDRLLAADPSRFDTSSLRVIASSGGALPGDLVERTAEAFGPVLHNLYGSTEVAYAAVATPRDLARDPRSAGRAPHGVTLRVVDADGRDCPPGHPGRVFVGNGMAFAGYTDGSDKDRLDGLVATGDLGALGADGLLTVLGRDDDMVVVGGENVFTGAVEDVLLVHPDVLEAAVVDVPDDTYGARLVAHVVTRGEVAPEQLQDWVAQRLDRHAVPREVVLTDELPRNATGKVVKRRLRSS